MKIKKNKKIILRLIKNYISPHKYRILFALLMMIISAGATGLHAWLVRPALDEVLIKGDRQMLYLIPFAIIITTIAKGFATYLHSFQMSKVSHKIIAMLQSEMFNKLMRFNLKFYVESKTGNLISRLINDTYQLRAAIIKSVTGVIKDTLVIIFLVGNMFYQSWELTIYAFFAFPLALWPIRKIGKGIRKITYIIQNEIATFSNVLGESIRGIRQVKAYGREKFEEKKANQTIIKIRNDYIKSSFISNRLTPIMEFIGSLAIALSIYVGGIFVLDNSMSAGQFMSFLVSLLLAYQPVKALANLNISMQEGLASTERIFELLDKELRNLEVEINQDSISIPKGKIEIKEIEFSYKNKKILENFNLVIPAGKKIALVGKSGSGKSTIINLILRFFDPQKGNILIDNQNINLYSLKSLREKISLVTQETFLFNDSVLANIKYGKLEASLEEVKKAASEAGATEFINDLPNGINTNIGESGIKLSGGQRQRIAIARALLKDAPILLLDEATSSLDNLSEIDVQDSIKRLMENRTCLIIAHRLSTVEDADIINVLDKGKIIGSGSHQSLISNNELYYKLYNSGKLNQ
ncbi:MAG: Lipid A export ATP-binding/permease protein MsbA [Alphaproteobacteria bacterium MarineAlpha5_Bin9]|nr:MAG: Lipid A export ATP-binding/permease protein MsbA [Alphaproteobacteria bacterium MarineAlpha5_Bin9]|tara:strand:+ start:6015 stop:7760 length:1746 start_codon:yes stop_codon:yes gene_type:complete